MKPAEKKVPFHTIANHHATVNAIHARCDFWLVLYPRYFLAKPSLALREKGRYRIDVRVFRSLVS